MERDDPDQCLTKPTENYVIITTSIAELGWNLTVKLEAFHEEPTGIHMISWKLQTNEIQERNGQMIPNAASMQLLNLPIFFF